MTAKKRTVYEALSQVQANLNAPKGQVNKFGGYSYRSCEDILQAVKPLLGEAVILVSDEIKLIGDRYYVEATAKFIFSGETVENKAYAREPVIKKGMDEAQITGATSSYARKYALNGLLLIDDNKDADTQDNRGNCSETTVKPHPNSKEGQAAKQKAREEHPMMGLLAECLASPERHDEAREMLAEITDEKEKISVWQLMTTAEKSIVRTFTEEAAA